MRSVSEAFLVRRAQAGDRVAANEAVERCRGICHSLAQKYYADGNGYDDLVQAAFIGVGKAVRTYNAGRGITFRTFAYFCAERQVQTLAKMARAGKHRALTLAASLDAPVADDMPPMQLPSRMTPERIMESRAMFDEICVAVDSDLTPTERTAVLGYAAGCSYDEIPGDAKAVDNALQRARRKLAPLAA